MDDIAGIAAALSSAIETGDIPSLRRIYAPTVKIWHNTDGIVQTLDENLQVVASFFEQISDRRFENRKLHIFEDGFAQQHLVSGTSREGRRVSFEACIFCKVKSGRIERLDEYFDSAAVAAALQ